MKRRIFVSTGEVSGDLQGALLVAALLRQAAQRQLDLEIWALGGERMAAAGAKLLADTSAIGSIGIVESLPYVLSTLRIQRRVKQQLRQAPPDLVVMIDYFGPNLAIGGFVRQALPQVPTVYYIAPQEWVWSINRHNTDRILQITDRLLAIFPAEADYYRAHGGAVKWVGHPLIDRMQSAPTRTQARQQLGIADGSLVVALIPASRRQELKYVLPVLAKAAQQIQVCLPQVQFWVPLSLERYRSAIETAMQRHELDAHLVSGESQTVIAAADLVMAKSGTVNLETALLNVPQVVMYRIHPLTAWIAEHLLRFSAPFVSPPNLVLMESLIPEFLQTQATPERLAAAALEILCHDERRQAIQAGYQRMRQQLGEVGVCDRAAHEILELLDTARLDRGIT